MNEDLTDALPEPRAWTLQSELDAGDSTCGAHLWFSNPRNTAWAPLYDHSALAAARAPLLAEVERLRSDMAALKTVMIAAAEEIHLHWRAHCDAEGYGPANLMRRLEEGIPSEYGYTAGAFESLRSERDAARALVRPGWQWVPVEPTDAMVDATYCSQPASDVWRDMLASAPQPPTQEPVP